MSIQVKRATKRIEFCTNLGLRSDYEAALEVLKRAQDDATRDARESGSVAVREAAAEADRIQNEMRDETLVFVLSALPRKEWVEFEASYPAREGVEDDKTLDLNVSELDRVIAPGIVKVENLDGEPVEFDASEWVELADAMSSGQWNEFALAAIQLNRGVTERPFSRRVSALTQG